MLNKTVEDMLMVNREHYVIPASMVATVQADNSLTHAFLVLTKVRYARIPVLDGDQFVGLISLPMVTETMLGLDSLKIEQLDDMCVRDVMDTEVTTVANPYALEDVMHLLVNDPFLPVVASTGEFTGIVTRREWMKSLNYICHDLSKDYDVTPKVTAHATGKVE